MLTEADMLRILTENFGAEKYGISNSLVEESIDREIYDTFDDADPYDQSCYDMSKPGDHTE